jgi:hypothetical protein
MGDPLEECWLKLHRGEEHLNFLNTEVQRFFASHPDMVAREYCREELKGFVQAQFSGTCPLWATHHPFQHSCYAHWALIIGDCVHNARSALDYLAWRLAGSDMADIHTQFPICNSIDKWLGFQWRYQRHPITLLAHAYIATLQPYTRLDANYIALWLLQELDALDKHKLLAMTGLAHPRGTVRPCRSFYS